MGSFLIQTTNGKVLIEGTIVKQGKGKKAVDVLGIAKESYQIYHIPTGLFISRPYEFLSQARIIANEVSLSLGSELQDPNLTAEAFSPELQIYLNQVWWGLKTPPSFEEFLNGPEFEAIAKAARPGEALSVNTQAQHDEELQGWDTTIGWVPSEQGTMYGRKLKRLIEGRPYDRTCFLPGDAEDSSG